MTPKDFKHDDGYWIFSDKKLYLINGSMMNRIWLSLTELMRRREDLTDEFLYPMRSKLEESLSIPEKIVNDAKLDEHRSFGEYLESLGVRLLRNGEKIKRK